MIFLNHYICPDCKQDWWDLWDRMCDDNCSTCNNELHPEEDSIELSGKKV